MVGIQTGITNILSAFSIGNNTITATYTCDSSAYKDTQILCNNATGISVKLPSVSHGRYLQFTDIYATGTTASGITHPVTVVPNGTEKIAGIATGLLLNANGFSVGLNCDGTNWWKR